MMKVQRVAQPSAGTQSGEVEMRDLAHGMHAGIGAAGAARPRPPVVRFATASSRACCTGAHCPGAASRRRGRRHIPGQGGSGIRPAGVPGRQREAALEIRRRQRPRPGRCSLSRRSAPRRRRWSGRRPAPGRACRALGHLGAENLHAFAGDVETGAGPGVQRAHPAFQAGGLPVQSSRAPPGSASARRWRPRPAGMAGGSWSSACSTVRRRSPPGDRAGRAWSSAGRWRRALQQHRAGLQASSIRMMVTPDSVSPARMAPGSAPHRASAAAARHGCSGSRAAAHPASASGRISP